MVKCISLLCICVIRDISGQVYLFERIREPLIKNVKGFIRNYCPGRHVGCKVSELQFQKSRQQQIGEGWSILGDLGKLYY